MSKKGPNELHEAVKRGDLSSVKKLLKKLSVTTPNACKQTPMHVAAAEGHVEIIVYLYERKKAPIDYQDRDGWTPLHCACHAGNLESIDQLLKYGADVNVQTTNGSTPMHYFVRIPLQVSIPSDLARYLHAWSPKLCADSTVRMFSRRRGLHCLKGSLRLWFRRDASLIWSIFNRRPLCIWLLFEGKKRGRRTHQQKRRVHQQK